jgi:hypothetical protein
MFPFANFDSLTAKIDKLIIEALKENSPGKYWSFWISDKLAKAGMYGGFWTCFSYVLVGMIDGMARGGHVDPGIVTLFGNTMGALLVVGVLATIVRTGLHKELEAAALEMWSQRLAKSPNL